MDCVLLRNTHMSSRHALRSARKAPETSKALQLRQSRPFFHPRTFVTSSSSSPPSATSLSAHRILPYRTLSIFDIIADIPSYPSYLPYCRSATVTSQSEPDPHFHRRWPQTADLTIGFQDKISETFSSRVFCAPPISHKGRAGVGFVEALSGSESGEPGFLADELEDLKHHFDAEIQGEDKTEVNKAQNENSPLALLRTRWTVGAYPYKPGGGKKPQEESLGQDTEVQQMTHVGLSIDYRFRSPVYEMLGRSVTGRVAEMMIEAFEGRVKA